MRNPVFILACVAVLLAPGVTERSKASAAEAQAAGGAARETVYQGRPLAWWTRQARAATGQARERAIQVLIQAFQSGDVNAMVAAADGLRQAGPAARGAASALAAQLDHPLGWVRTAAMDALAAIGRAAVPAVQDAFEHGTPGARQRAAIVLGTMGREARAALPALQSALEQAPVEQRDSLKLIVSQVEGREAAGGNAAAKQAAGHVDRVAVAGESTQLATGGEGGWAQFHGPRRDGASRETGLLKAWPEGGPKLLWTMKGLGRGFSSVSGAGGRILTMGDRVEGTSASQFVIAFDLATRKELWATRVGAPHLKEGPRCTPTVDGERVFALGTDGVLVCLEAATGKLRWQKDLAKDFGGKVMSGWKWSESPLVDGGRVICTPGAPEAALVALNKETGEVIWKCAAGALGPKGKDGAGYSSVVVAEIGGVRQYVQMLGRGLVGVEAQSGRLLWSYNGIASPTANINHPLVLGDDVFTANGYNTGSALLKISRDGKQGEGSVFKVEEVYTLGARQFSSHHGGFVAAGGYVYGGIGDNAGAPVCLEAATGKVIWQAKAPEGGSATVLYADGGVIFRYDRGLVVLIEATPEGFKVKGRFTPPLGEGPAWAHMALADGKLYLRHGDLLACYELRGQEK